MERSEQPGEIGAEIFPKPRRLRMKRRKTSVFDGLPLVSGVSGVIPFGRSSSSRKELPLRNGDPEAVFLVEENIDKKKPFSDDWWVDPFTSQKILGNIWKTRVLIATKTAVALFSIKRNMATTDSWWNIGERNSKLLDFARDVVIYIRFEDVISLSELPASEVPGKNGFILHVVQRTVSGRFSSIIALEDVKLGRELMQLLKSSKTAVSLSKKALDDGLFDLSQNDLSKAYRIVSVYNSSQVYGGLTSWEKSVEIDVNEENLLFNIKAIGPLFEEVEFTLNRNQIITKPSVTLALSCEGLENMFLHVSVREIEEPKQMEPPLKQSFHRMYVEPLAGKYQSQSVPIIAVGALFCGVIVANLNSGNIVFMCLILLFFYLMDNAERFSYVINTFQPAVKIKMTHEITFLRIATTPFYKEFEEVKHEQVIEALPPPMEAFGRQRSASNLERYARTAHSPMYKSIHGVDELKKRNNMKSFRSYASNDQDTDELPSLSIDDESTESCGLEDLLTAVEDAEPDMLKLPKRWLIATKHDRNEAFLRWKKSLDWRQQEGINSILHTTQPHFEVIKNTIPHILLGNDPAGNLGVVLDLSNLKEKIHRISTEGVTPRDFAYHHVFVQEFWINSRLTRTGKLKEIIDMKGITMFSFTPLVMSFLSGMKDIFMHYPECICAVYLVNVPTSFKLIWKLVTPFLDKNTLNKFQFLTGKPEVWQQKLRNEFPPEILPKAYGGDFEEGYSEYRMEKLLRHCVDGSTSNLVMDAFVGYEAQRKNSHKGSDVSTVSLVVDETTDIHEFMGLFKFDETSVVQSDIETIVALSGRKGSLLVKTPFKKLRFRNLKMKLKQKRFPKFPDSVFVKLTTYLGPLKTVLYAKFFSDLSAMERYLRSRPSAPHGSKLRNSVAAYENMTEASNSLVVSYLTKTNQRVDISICAIQGSRDTKQVFVSQNFATGATMVSSSGLLMSRN